jgi:hypothetical protein
MLRSSPSLKNPSWTSTGNSPGTFTQTISGKMKFYRVIR